MRAYRQSMEVEASPLGRNILHFMVENAAAARAGGLPVCQDTGLIVVFADLGQEVHITGGDFAEAVHQGVRQGYQKGCFRASSVDAITRVNRGDNSPAIIHLDFPLIVAVDCRGNNLYETGKKLYRKIPDGSFGFD